MEEKDLPKGWELKKFIDACDILDNMRIPINSSERNNRIEGKQKNELFPYYGATGQVGYIDEYIMNGEYILLGEDAAPFLEPFKDKAYLVTGKFWVNNHAHILKAKESNKFLLHYLNTVKYNDFVTGTTRLKLNQGRMKEIPVPLPSFAVQNEIVSKIEELFSELDKGIEQLRTAKEQLKVYRQSVLKWAFEGKLTNKNVKDGELPKGWKLESIGEVSIKQTLKALPKEHPDLKFIGMDCIEPHTLKPNFLYDFKDFKSSGNYFEKDQVLYGRMRPYLNKVYKAEFTGACSGEFIVLQCTKIFNPDLLKYILHSDTFVKFANSKTSGDRPRITFDEFKDYPVGVTTLQEQQQIVQEIESRLSVCDKVEETIETALKQSESLRQSILKKAFEGKLI